MPRRLVVLHRHLLGGVNGNDPSTVATEGSSALDVQQDDITAAYARAEKWTNIAALLKVVHSGEAAVHWIDGGRQLWWLRRWTSKDGAAAKQFMIMDPAAGTAPVAAFNHARLAQGLMDARLVSAPPPDPWALPFSSLAEFSPTHSFLTFKLGGKHYRCDLQTYEVAEEAEPGRRNSSIEQGVLSPDGELVAFVRDHNLWLRSTADGKETALSHDGQQNYAYATPLPGAIESASAE